MAFNAGEIVAKIRAEATGIKAGIQQAKEEVKGFKDSVVKRGKELQAAGKTLTTYVTAPIIAIGTMAIKTAGDFQAGMNRVKALANATGEQFGRLRQMALEMGRTTQFSATQAADALGFLAMAGFDAEEQMGALPGVLQLAAAANLDLAQTADIASNILTGYGFKVEELGRVNDVLAKAFTSANVDLSMLAESMKYAGPVASSAGMQFEEAAAAVALMGNAGIQGSMAGTALRGAISRLLNPSKEAAAVLKTLGVTATDSAGQLLPLNQIIEQLEKSGATTGDMLTVFGDRAGPALAALVEQGSGALRNLTGELINSGGTAERIAKTQMEGWRGAWLTFKSALEGVAITIGDQLLPIAQKLIERVTGWFNWFNNLSEGTRTLIIVIAGLVAAIGPLLMAAGTFLTILPSLVVGFKMLSAAMTGFLGPAGIIALVVAAIVGLVVAFGNTKKGIITHTDELLAESRDRFAKMRDETQKAVAEKVRGVLQQYQDLKNRGILLFQELRLRSVELTEKNRDELLARVAETKDGYLQLLKTQHDEGLELIREGLLLGIIANEEHAAELFQQIEESYAGQQGIVERGFARIKEIMEQAFVEQRQLTKDELSEIEELYREMYDALIADQEKKVGNTLALEIRMFRDLKSASAEEIKERIEQAEQWTKDEIAVVEDMVGKRIEWIERMWLEQGLINDAEAARLIEEAISWGEEQNVAITDKRRELLGELLAIMQNEKLHINKETGLASQEMIAILAELWGEVYGLADEGMGNFAGAIEDGRVQVVFEVDETGKATIRAIRKSRQDWENVGGDLVDGWARGILNNQSAAVNAAVSVAVQTLNAAKMALKVESPSKEFEFIGRMIPAGLARGIEGALGWIDRAMGKMTDRIGAAAGFGAGGLAFAGGGYGGGNGRSGGLGLSAQFMQTASPAAYDFSALGGAISSALQGFGGSGSSRSIPPVVSIQIDGREFVRATIDDIDAELGRRKTQKDRNRR